MKNPTHEELDRIALKLFRLVHGRGDGGSEFEFRNQNPALIDGWMLLARAWRSKNELEKILNK